ncbi:PREDICTED: C-X-C motif chemokine 10-like [Nanorana parkeri]|uniref:C-X-C motif chemokine 10-like n=1 Tax=Nanorana parkeri TaxID=125878 RepID=UPI000854DB7F|nr:PREDICTED: C-X-C motif chemokine 10-like [Nanorana parkeri]
MQGQRELDVHLHTSITCVTIRASDIAVDPSYKMTKILIALLGALLILQCVQGMSPLGRRRCHCLGRLSNSVDVKQIKKLEMFPESSRCEKMEVVAKLRNGEEKCLNPNSKVVKSIIAWGKTRSGQASGK